MPSKLGEWLQGELDKRGWSMRKLALRSGVHPVSVGDAVRRGAIPEVNSIIRMAEALGEDPVFALRLAGVVPSLVPETTDEEKLLCIFRVLPHHLRQAVMWMVRGMHIEYQRGIAPRTLSEGQRVRVVLEGTVVGEADEPDHYQVRLDESRRIFPRDQLLEVTVPVARQRTRRRTGED
jgi:transcriptional regulator with XRE-family HTH domain